MSSRGSDFILSYHPFSSFFRSLLPATSIFLTYLILLHFYSHLIYKPSITYFSTYFGFSFSTFCSSFHFSDCLVALFCFVLRIIISFHFICTSCLLSSFSFSASHYVFSNMILYNFLYFFLQFSSISYIFLSHLPCPSLHLLTSVLLLIRTYV